ncbi:MAG: FAD-dependent oxidoreductase [Peptococcaceae bacterium]|nr:FAD-dependent oxidoreductase [Peptococcaceae bacterium]
MGGLEKKKLKVAVIGAGVAGLSCAVELERHGLSPVVFEQRPRPGELFEHCAAVLRLYSRPYDPLAQLREEFRLELRPISRIKKITMKSFRKKVTVKGNLGYLFLRGQARDSVESQLFAKIKSGITADTRADYLDLSKKFDYVVVANGSYDAGRTEGIWSPVIRTKVVGGSVVGKFDPEELVMWVDTRYSRTSYAYLAPFWEKRAFLGLVVPDSSVEEARRHWKLFWEIEQHPFEQVSEVVVEHNAGFVYPHQVGNILFAGVAGGFQEPFLGFGLIPAAKSGTLAGRAVATGRRYEDLLAQLKKDTEHSLVFREMINKAKNDDYDMLLGIISVPGLKQAIYNTNLDVLRIAAAAAGRLKGLIRRFKSG